MKDEDTSHFVTGISHLLKRTSERNLNLLASLEGFRFTMSWCTIESDPAVFNELVETFGTKGVEFAELWGLDDESLASLEPIYGTEKSGGERRQCVCEREREE